VKVNSVNLEDFRSNNFNCPFLGVGETLISFDEVRKHVWSQLRSVDALKLEPDRIIMYEFSTFEDLTEILASHNCKGGEAFSKKLEEKLKTDLFTEYRAKLFESLFLLALLGEIPNGKIVEFRIVICVNNQRDIYFYEVLRRKLKKYLANKLYSLFPPRGNDKVIVILGARNNR